MPNGVYEPEDTGQGWGGWGWSGAGGWTYGGAPQTAGPTTQQGIAYDPGTDPVLDAFRAGYQLPAPGQGRGGGGLFPTDRNAPQEGALPELWDWISGWKGWGELGQSIPPAVAPVGRWATGQAKREWERLKYGPSFMAGAPTQQGVATQGTPMANIVTDPETGKMYDMTDPARPVEVTTPVSPEMAQWQQQAWGELDKYKQWEVQGLADKARIEELSGKKPLPPNLNTAIKSWLKPNESRAKIEEPVDANGYPAIQTAEQETAFYEKYAYNKAYYDQSGNLLTDNEVKQLAETNPNTLVTRVYDIGGGISLDVSNTALGFEEEGGVTAGWLGQMAESKEAIAKSKAYQEDLQAKKDEILTDVNAGNYQEKRAELYNLYGTEYQPELTLPSAGGTWEQAARLGMTGTPDWYSVGAEVMNAMSPKDQKAVQAQADAEQDTDEWNASIRPEYEDYKRQTGSKISFQKWKEEVRGKAPTPFDTGSLQESIASYGISVLDNYPYISPISPAQLRKIPVDILEQMASYLQSKGINWNDFVSIGSSWYGGQVGAGGRWAIPAQWG